MNTAKKYYNSEGEPRSIWKMVREEPDWAANRVQEGEKAIEELAILKASQPAVEVDTKCSTDFHKEEYLNGSTFCRVCGKRIRTA